MSTETVRCDCTGIVWKVLVAPGDDIAAGATLLLVESMKMELPVVAPRAGKVVRVYVAEGAEVAEGEPVVDLG